MGKIVCTFGKILAIPLLVIIAIQMVCLWLVGILNPLKFNLNFVCFRHLPGRASVSAINTAEGK